MSISGDNYDELIEKKKKTPSCEQAKWWCVGERADVLLMMTGVKPMTTLVTTNSVDDDNDGVRDDPVNVEWRWH